MRYKAENWKESIGTFSQISLSMKEASPNPWREIAERNPSGTVVKGKIRNITDFGLFVGLDEGIDGLVHVSDMSWSQRQRNPNEVYKKGDEIEVKVLNMLSTSMLRTLTSISSPFL